MEPASGVMARVVQELTKLPGIGPKLSKRIVDERDKARFKSVEDLRRVSGIGPKILERLRPHVTVGSPTEEPPTGDKAPEPPKPAGKAPAGKAK